jgi:hypothetical protein
MTAHATRSNAALATNGALKLADCLTRELLSTPAAVATMPFRTVARPRMTERSEEGSAREVEEERSHDSKEE